MTSTVIVNATCCCNVPCLCSSWANDDDPRCLNCADHYRFDVQNTFGGDCFCFDPCLIILEHIPCPQPPCVGAPCNWQPPLDGSFAGSRAIHCQNGCRHGPPEHCDRLEAGIRCIQNDWDYFINVSRGGLGACMPPFREDCVGYGTWHHLESGCKDLYCPPTGLFNFDRDLGTDSPCGCEEDPLIVEVTCIP